MIGLGEFFKKVQNSFSKEILVRTIIKDIIKKQTGIEISIENISYKRETIWLNNLSQMTNSVIFIKKQVILKEINSKQSIWKVVDIR